MKILAPIDLSKNELQNAVIQNLSTEPSTPKVGQIFYNTSDNLLYVYTGVKWEPVGAPVEAIDWKIVFNTPTTFGLGGYGITDIKLDSSAKSLIIGKDTLENIVTDANYIHTDNNFTTVLKQKLEGISEGAEVNTIDTLSLNGVPLNPDAQKNIDIKVLSTSGGEMAGTINMASYRIMNLPEAVDEGDAINKKQLDNTIAGIGTVFNLKGSKKTVGDLPKEKNKIGDVWYVIDEEVGYIWIDKEGILQWERFGAPIDLSGYLTKEGLLSTTGSEITNTMHQKAITEELAKKADNTTVEKIPVVKTAVGTIGLSASSATVNYTGTIVNVYAKDSNGEAVIVDVNISSSNVVFSTASAPAVGITCTVVYI